MHQAKKSLMSLAITLGLSLLTATADANPTCQALLHGRSAKAKAITSDDPVAQWLEWEQTANFKIFRKSKEVLMVPAIEVPKKDLVIDSVQGLDQELISALQLDKSQALWVKHPYNTAANVPYLNNQNTVHSFRTYLTSSRSLLLEGFLKLYTIKMPTDHPHGPQGQFQPGKGSTRDDILSGLSRTRHVERVEKESGHDDQLILAKEVLTVADKATGEGYLVRDVSFMRDGNYYLPAFSLPYVGREIAKVNGHEPDAFWREAYGAALGRAKAKLLLRYGLQMETPNTQNILIQLDRNLKPTGRIVFRDLSDSFLVDFVAKNLGFDEQLKLDAAREYKAVTKLKPYWENSAWRLDEAGQQSYSKRVVEEWGKAHDDAYLAEIEQALAVKIPDGPSVSSYLFGGGFGSESPTIMKIDTALRLPLYAEKLKRYSLQLSLQRQKAIAAQTRNAG